MQGKKMNKPEYFVDLTQVKGPEDVLVAFGIGKQASGKPISYDEMVAIIDHELDMFTDYLHEAGIVNKVNGVVEPLPRIVMCPRCKKMPWYKRFWRWLTTSK